MSRTAPCPDCARDVGVSQYGKCALCGKQIAEAVAGSGGHRNPLAIIALLLGIAVVGFAVLMFDPFSGAFGVGLVLAGYEYLYTPM